MFAELRRWCDSGRLAVFTTQVPHEGCDLAVYEVGRAVGELPGVLEAHDMTPEAVAVKLMWALGKLGPDFSLQGVRTLMQTNICGELKA